MPQIVRSRSTDVMDMHVRPARVEDRERLLELWERSVRATHHFLEDSDVVALRPLVAEELASDALDWWVLASATEAAIGFLGFASDTIEALFVDPDHHGQGAASSWWRTRRVLVVRTRWRSMSTSRMKPRWGSTRRSGSRWWGGRRGMRPAGHSPCCI
jgi:GNAT superfamily N-acetyltransferase